MVYLFFRNLEFSDAKIVFATWDDSEGLKEFFSKKFEGIRNKDYSHLNGNDCLEVKTTAGKASIAIHLDLGNEPSLIRNVETKCFVNKYRNSTITRFGCVDVTAILSRGQIEVEVILN